MKNLTFSLLAIVFFISQTSAQYFTEASGPGHLFLDMYKSASATGDVDNDGDLDLLIMGESDQSGYPYAANLYLNDGLGAFTLDTSIVAVGLGSVDLGDMDGDGDLDFVVTGGTQTPWTFVEVAEIYENDGDGSFSLKTSLPQAVDFGSCAKFGDIDGNGSLDLVVLGHAGLNNNKIYTNDGSGAFTESGSTLPFGASSEGEFEFVDVDGDTDLDLIVVGKNASTSSRMTQLLVNDGLGNFTVSPSSSVFEIAGDFAKIAVEDIDGDDDMDILICGRNDDATDNRKTNIYTNDGTGTFTKVVSHGLDGVMRGEIQTLDYDADGDMDIIISGANDTALVTSMYENDGTGSFTEVVTSDFNDMIAYFGSISVFDANDNGRMDLFFTGQDSDGEKSSKLFFNQGSTAKVSEGIFENNVLIYPNPTKRLLNIVNGSGNALILDLTGKVVLEMVITNQQLDVSALKNGVYLLQLTTERGVTTQRFIKE